MVRTNRCLIVALLTAGVAQSAPSPETLSPSHPPRIRFLSLAEAQAIALERGNFGQPSLLFPGIGLDSRLAAPQETPPQDSGSIRVLARPGKKGILITGIPSDSRLDEYKRNLNQALLNVETAYWNLYGSYWQLYSREQGLRFAYEAWKIVGAEYKAGRASPADFAQAEGQYNLFRSQRLQALDTVLDNERQLRAMLELPTDGSVRLVPSDAPTLVEQKPDWEKALSETLKNRPELHLARAHLTAARWNYLLVKNIVLPILRILDPNACAMLDNWSVPIGRHLPADFIPPGPPCLRQASLQLTTAYNSVLDQELKAERFLGLCYRRMSSAYVQIKAARKQREAFATQLCMRTENYPTGKKDGTLDLVLEAQRFWADALATEYQAIATYNNAICGWEFAKGTIMAYAHVRLSEGPPPDHKVVRAVVREHKRTRQQVCRTSAVSANSPLTAPDDHPFATAVSLPALWMSFPPLRDAAEQLTEWKVSDIFPPCVPPSRE